MERDLQKLAEQFLKEAPEEKFDFEPISEAPWLHELEKRLGRTFPPSFHALYDNFRFPSFYLEEVEFFANLDSDAYEDIRVSLLRDEAIVRVTLENGYIHFAKSADGSYDPICFNTSQRSDRDFEIVRLDHEAILQFEKIVRVKVIAPSLKEYMRRHVSS